MKNLSWKRAGEAYLLASPSEELIKLSFHSDGRITFLINKEKYELKRSGFWDQRYSIYRNHQEVVSVSHSFWGSKGKVSFPDMSEYTSVYLNENGVKLRLMEGELEVLNYQVGIEHSTRKATFHFGINLVDAEKLLLLAALGMIMFMNIITEFKTGTDEENIVFMTTS